MKSILLEAVLVAAVGSMLAFAANFLSPRGIALGRNFFPSAPSIAVPPRHQEHTNSVTGSGTNLVSASNQKLEARLKAEGLQLLDETGTLGLYNDPGRQQNAVIFIDVRDEQHYQEGHIPGAYQFDRYHPENYLATIVPLCLSAQKVVVYCNGGECEDSEFAARFLKDDVKVPAEKLFVYGGGITEWSEHKRPIEKGERISGAVENASTPPK